MTTVVNPIIGVVFMGIAMVAAVKFWPRAISDFILPRIPQKKGPAKVSSADEALFLVMFALLIVYATVTHFLGTHLWGCFIAGMSFACVLPPHHAHHVWVKQTKRVTSWMIRIFFAGTVAFSIPVSDLMSFEAFWKGSILGIVACIGTKVLCAPFMGKARFVIGWAMVGRAEFAYLIAQMALAGGMMDAVTFSMVIWALLYATIFAPFVFRYLLNKYVASEGLGSKHQDQEMYLEDQHDMHEMHGVHDPDGKPQFGATELDYAKKDLEDIDVAGAMKNGPTQFGARSPGGELRAEGRVAKEEAKGPGQGGFLCCLFFKKVVVH